MDSPNPALPPLPPSSLRYRILVAAALLVAGGAFLLAVQLTNTKADDPVTVSGGQPGIVQQLIPSNGSSALRQSEFGVDLAPGYDAALLVNGVEIPREQLRTVPAQNQVFFTPGPGKAIEELDAGQTCVVAIIWKSARGRGTAEDKTVSWCFTVT